MAAAKKEKAVVQAAGREVAISNPGKVYFPEAGITKLEVVQYYLAVAEGALRGAGGRPNVLVRYADGIHGEFFYQKRAPASRPDWIEVVALQLPLRPHRGRGRPARRRRPGLDGEPRLPGAAPAPGARGGPRPSRRAARRPRSRARVEWPQIVAVARRRPRGAGRARARGLAQDVGLARHPRERAPPPALVVHAGAAGRAGPGPRGGAARARPRHQPLVEGGAPGRLPRLQPEREGPHGGQRVLGAAQARRAGVRAPDLGGARRTAGPRTSRCARCPRASPPIGDRHADIDAHPCSLDAVLELSARQEAEGQGDAPWPPHYVKQPGEPPRVAPSTQEGRDADRTPRLHQAAPRDRPRPARRTRPWPGSSAGRPATRRRPPTSSPPTCSSTRCAAATRPGRACA